MDTVKANTTKTSGIRNHIKKRSGERRERRRSGVENLVDNNKKEKEIKITDSIKSKQSGRKWK